MARVHSVQVVASLNRNVGGPAESVSRLASALEAAGCSTTVATLDYPELGARADSGATVHAIAPNAASRALRGFSPALHRAIRGLASTPGGIVHSHGLWMFPNYYAGSAARHATSKLVVSPRGMLDPWALSHHRLRKRFMWRLWQRSHLARADLLHATSADESEAIRALGFPQPIAILPNGVQPAPEGPRAGREVLEAAHPRLRGKSWALFLSRLHPKKGVIELLQAWASLPAPVRSSWHLVIAGPALDGFEAVVGREVGRKSLDQEVTLTGMLAGEAKRSALDNASLFVLPTHSENFGIAIAEALASGLPVITTRAAPWGEVHERGCGWWIDDTQPALDAALLEALSSPPERLRAMGEAARGLARASLGWDRIGREMLGAYRWLLEGGPRPACVAVR